MRLRSRLLLASIVVALIALVFLLLRMPPAATTPVTESGPGNPRRLGFDEGSKRVHAPPDSPAPGHEPSGGQSPPVIEATAAVGEPGTPGQIPSESSPALAPAASESAPGSGLASPPDAAGPLRYGCQVLVAATLDSLHTSLDGVPQDLPLPGGKLGELAYERWVFVSETSVRNAWTGLAEQVRLYSSCGVAARFRLFQSDAGDPETAHPRPGDSAFPSALEGAQVKPGPASSLVLFEAGSADAEPLDLRRTRWDLGAFALLPSHPVSTGSRWTLPARTLGPLVSPGGDLLIRNGEDDDSEIFAPALWGTLTTEPWSASSGEIVATAARAESAGSPDGLAAALSIDLRGESGIADIGELLGRAAARAPEGLEGDGTTKFSFEGIGAVQGTPGASEPPRSEIHCEFTEEVELHFKVGPPEARSAEVSFRMHGHFAFLGGLSRRDETLGSAMWAPRDEFLSPKSFVVRR